MSKDVIGLAASLITAFEAGNRVISPKTHHDMLNICLPFLVSMHDEMNVHMNPPKCEELGFEPEALIENVMVAKWMIKGEDESFYVVDSYSFSELPRL